MKKLLPLCVLVLGLGVGRADAGSLGLFDSHPGLAQGCTAAGFSVCLAQAPYGFTGPATGLPDETSPGSIGGGDGGVTSGIQTFAVWSRSAVIAIPEPSTLGLLCAGFVAMVVSLSRRRRPVDSPR